MGLLNYKISAVLVAMLITQQVEAGDIAYYSASDTYFELVYTGGAIDANRLNWRTAAERAAKMSHRGREGRLAVVDTPEKHQFIREHFQWRLPTWIGLRYWCSSRMMMWVNGVIHEHSGFQNWAIPWHRTHIRCGKNNIPYMPVYYTEAAQWQASGSAKKFRSLLVEYPSTKGKVAGQKR